MATARETVKLCLGAREGEGEDPSAAGRGGHGGGRPPPLPPDSLLAAPGGSVHMETMKLEGMQLAIAVKRAPRT